MANSSLSIAVWRYDRTQPLYDGRVGIPGRRLNLIEAPLEELFHRAFTKAEFDVAELSFSNFLRLSVAGKCPYIGLPVFPSRSFRHGVFYVREGGPVQTPADLVGKRVGVREFSMTAALAARGALRDHYGISSSDINWVMGDVDEKERDTIPLPELYKPIRIEAVDDGGLLGPMLESGELDAILAYKPVTAYKERRGVRRLIPDHVAAEADYFRRTGIFPVMHLVGIRKDLMGSDPQLASEVITAFNEAQKLAGDDLRTEQALKIGLPWVGHELARTIEIMGSDFWPSGLEANRRVLTRMIEWSYEDGLIPHVLPVDTLFIER